MSYREYLGVDHATKSNHKCFPRSGRLCTLCNENLLHCDLVKHVYLSGFDCTDIQAKREAAQLPVNLGEDVAPPSH